MTSKKSGRAAATLPSPPPAAAEVRQTEVVPIGDLRPHPRNYKTHPDDQLDHIGASLRQHGWYRNVVVARDLTILAGHGVVAAAKRIGLTEAPVFRLPVDPDSSAALKILASDNELGKFAETDDRALTELLRDIKDTDPTGLFGTGFDGQMLASLVFVTRPASEIVNHDAAAEYIGMPEYQPTNNVSGACRLMVSFDTEADREVFIRQNSLIIHKKLKGEGGTYTTYWPPRPRDDIASLKFKETGGEEEPAGEGAA